MVGGQASVCPIHIALHSSIMVADRLLKKYNTEEAIIYDSNCLVL